MTISKISKTLSYHSMTNTSRVVIHAGDIVSPETVKAFDGMRLIGVLGNNDLEVNELSTLLIRLEDNLKVNFAR